MSFVFRLTPFLIVSLLFSLAVAPVKAQSPATITVEVDKPGKPISPLLYGVFFEEINHSGDGGVYAEMVRNRSLEDREKTSAWKAFIGTGGGATLTADISLPLNAKTPTALRVDVTAPGGSGAANEGFWGLAVEKGKSYRYSLFARRAADAGHEASIAVVTPDGKRLMQRTIRGLTEHWKRFEGTIRADESATNAQLALIFPKPGAYYLDVVSLFPAQTYKKRKNGLRPDLAQMVADLKPAFMRFPGGCFCEGDKIENAFRWKESLGDISERPGHFSLWGYRSADGLGYHEYLQWCEDLKTEPLFVVNVGMSHAGPVSMAATQEFVQDALDAIEYANGPTSTQWGALRAKNGHPAPFNLRYMEIGNENGGPPYQERYALFYDAIKRRYPYMNLIANEPTTSRPADIVDEHDYSTPEHFAAQATRYDGYNRKTSKIYMGEYAVTQGAGLGNLKAAIGEAAFMTGMERNADHVLMSSYAPLFVNVHDRAWNPDAIVFDNARAFGTPSYWTQALFAQNRPDVLLPVEINAPPVTETPAAGYIGVGTWRTQAEFKDVQVTQDGKSVYSAPFADTLPGWRMVRGDWKFADGAARQTGIEDDRRLILASGFENWRDYTLTLKARKLSGEEGFLVLFRGKSDNDWSWWNIGGWGNQRHALEKSAGGAKSVVTPFVPGSIENNRWYDIRIELHGDRIRCYLDNVLIHDFRDAPTPLYAVAGYDTKRGETILKIVNFSDQDITADVILRGAKSVASEARVSRLTSADPGDENTFEQPQRIIPKSSFLRRDTPAFRDVFPRWSLTILRVKTK